jgi:hypothetical protein
MVLKILFIFIYDTLRRLGGSMPLTPQQKTNSLTIEWINAGIPLNYNSNLPGNFI